MCVLPSLLCGAEVWYDGRKKNPRIARQGHATQVSTRVGYHIDRLQAALTTAPRTVVQAYKTTPRPALFREAGLPSTQGALEEARFRFAFRLQTVDPGHPLAHRIKLPRIEKGGGPENFRHRARESTDSGGFCQASPAHS